VENNVNASIRVNLDTSEALSSLQSLQTRISSFNKSVIQSNAQAVAAQRGLLSNFQAEIGSSRQFSTSIRTSATEVSRLQTAIDKNKLSTGQYFKYAAASSKNFGKIFTQENEKITRLATERVRSLQTQYIALGEAQGGMQKSLLARPLNLFNAEAAISVQKMQIFNKLLRDGGTSIVNWGKNTQWAGRQLMVGFTVPLTIFGATASKIFMDLEEQAISFKKVYGDIFTTTTEVEENLEAVRSLSEELTKYGIAITDTMETANVAAQAGFRGEDLMSQTQEATRLAVLGQMEQSEAMRTTITLQNAFKLSNEDLADAVNYLNIVENQTVLSIQDFAGAIPRVAPVIQSLGGDVRDLSVMLVAMREGGVTAAEGANALKTSLARLISPTSGASSMAKELGINLDGIVEANQGDILGAVMQLAKAMESLDELAQQRLLSEIFGKRQYARIGALFNNITDEASQSARALDLAGMSVEQLAETAENELGVVEQAIGTKFTGAVERLKLAIAPIGETFLKIATPIINAAGNLLEKFNELSPTVKNFVAILAAGVGIVVPSVLMLVGLFGNLLGNLVKGFGTLNTFFNRLRYGAEAAQYLSGEQLDAAAAAASLEGQTTSLTGSLNIQREAVDQLSAAYRRYVAGANAAASNLPQGFRRPVTPATMATGGVVGGVGNKDTEPALLTPGEFVINADASKKFAPLLAAINEGKIGKYARGRTEGNISFGRLGSVNIPAAYGQVSIDRIQAMADDLAGAGDDVRLAFKQILEDLSQTQGLTKGMVQQAEALKSSQFPEISGMAGESKYSASKAGERRSIEEQLRQDLAERANNEELIRQEYARAQAAADGAVASINNYYDDLVANAQTQEEINDLNIKRAAQVEEASRIDRAHIVELTNAQKLERESWNARLWMPQSGVENQLSNMLATSENNRAIYEQYLMDLADTSVSEDQRLTILEKVRGNIALTDEELDIQSRVLQRIVEDAERNAILVQKANGEFAKISPQFVPYAQGAIGAAEGRAAMGSVDPAIAAERIAMSQGVIGGIRTDLRANSPSEAAADVADSIPEGVAKGIKRSTPQATAAARELAQEVEGQLMMEFEDDDALFPAAPYKGKRRLQPTTPTQGQQRDPLPVAPKSVQDDLIKATKNASNNLDNVGKQSGQVAKRFSRLKGGVSKFGGALKNGSGKMQGAFFALDGLVFAASMADNSLGKIAQQALPLVFGIQGLTMVLPLLANPIVLAAAAVASVGIGMKLWSDRVNAARQKTVDYIVALDGSIQSLGSFAEKFGTMLPTERFRQILQGVTTEEEQERVSESQEFLREGPGKAIIERVSGLSMEEKFNALKMELLQGVAFEIMTPEQAKTMARALGIELSSPALGHRLVMSIRDAVKNDGKVIENAFVDVINESVKRSESLTASFAKSIEENTREMTSADIVFDPSVKLTDEQAEQVADDAIEAAVGPGYGEALEDAGIKTNEMKESTESLTRVVLGMDDVLNFVGPAINNIGKLAQAQDNLNIRFREGLVDLENYSVLTGKIEGAREGLSGAFTNLLQADGGVQQFNDAFDKTLTTLGKTQEEIDAINNQASAAAESITALVEGADEDVVKMGIKVGLAEESVTPEEIASFYSGLAQDVDLAAKAEIILQGASPQDIPRLIQLINEMSNLPEDINKKIMAEFNSDPKNWSEINRLLMATTRFSEFPNLQEKAMNIAINGDQEAQQNLSKMERYINSIAENSEISANFNFDLVNLIDLKRANDNWESLSKKKNISKIIKANDQFSSVFDKFNFSYKQIDSLPDLVKRAILLKLEVQAQLDLKVNETKYAKSFSGGAHGGAAMQQSQGLREIENLVQSGIDGLGGNDGDGGDDGTGGAEKSFLEDFIDNINANAKLYLDAEKGLKGYMKNRGKFLGAFQKLRNRGLSEDIISSLGTGPEGLKNAKELLKKNREQIKKLSEASRLDSLGQTVESLRREKGKTKEKTAAARAIKGLSPELQDIVMNDEQFISSFAKVKVGSKEYNKLVKEVQKLANAKRKLAEETQTEFEAQEQATKAMIDSLELQIKKNEDDLINAFEKTHGMLPEMMKLEISKREESIRVIQKQIDELEELNEIDEERIEGLSRQQEMLERQIEVLDRANEMDQRRIELLNRQDEIRSRESEALSKELDDMSKIEQELRDSHQKRVEQLEKVADVNDYILNQQKQQLNISRAISEGDIYSATAAAQEMRAGSAEFSKRQLISGLEAGLENQVSNLRTSDGLTRDQAERQIANIKEQSYQTSLQIRQIEDMIYQRNQQMIPLKDQQYSLDMQIRNIEDLIYDRNVEKKQIFDEQIEPLETQNNLQNEYLRKLNLEIDHVNGPLKAKQNHLDRILDLEGASQKVTGEIRDMTNRARIKADDLSDSWDDVTRSIFSALGMLSQFNGAKAAKSYAGGIVEGYSKGGKIKGYSVGGVAGNGSRDSVPAMLTPGEFVIRKAMVNKYGQSMMHDINMGSFSMPGYGAPERSSNVSPADVSVSNISSISAPVYNVYDMNFSINGSNQSADEIANRVMVKMRQLQSHNIRSNRGN